MSGCFEFWVSLISRSSIIQYISFWQQSSISLPHLVFHQFRKPYCPSFPPFHAITHRSRPSTSASSDILNTPVIIASSLGPYTEIDTDASIFIHESEGRLFHHCEHHRQVRCSGSWRDRIRQMSDRSRCRSRFGHVCGVGAKGGSMRDWAETWN